MINVEDYRKKLMVVIADDLTGANEIGIVLSEHNKKAFILSGQTSYEDIESLMDCGRDLVVNLCSRNLDGGEAYQRVKAFLSCSEKIKERLVYKKIDSTVRGNLAEEIDAILDLKFIDMIFLAPAFPELKRITVGGYHLVNQVPINKTQYARSAKCIKTSYLPALLAEKSKYKMDRVPLQVVESGYKEIIKYTKACYKKGIRIMIGDACTDEDLGNTKDAILNIDLKILPVGSAGLFQQFFPPDNSFNAYPCLVVCGSFNKVTHAQVRRLAEEDRAKNVELNLPQVFENKDSELRRVVEVGTSALKKGCELVLSTPQRQYRSNSTMEAQEKRRIIVEIDRFLSVAVRKIIERQRVSGLILTGGSISSAVISGLEATGMEIKGQLAPLIPLGILKGGPFEGLPVITKAGGFGEEDVLIKAVKHLRSGNTTR